MFKKLFSIEYISLLAISVILAINSILFLWLKTNSDPFMDGINPALATSKWHYPIYLISAILLAGTLLYHSKKMDWMNMLVKTIIVTLPAEIIFIYELREIDPHYTPLNFIFHFLPTLWIYLASFLILCRLSSFLNIKISLFKKDIDFKDWIVRQGKFYLSLLGLIMAISFGFGFHNIQKAAIVDEALWTFDRIPGFWKNVGERDWYGARVSDKPGLTTAVVSGLGLLKIDDPKKYDSKDIAMEKIEELNFAFRLPILIFMILMLPVLYFFIERLLGKKSAIFSIIFIGLSPILIGMSRMINPDAFLWVFSTISIISFLIFLEKKKDSAIIWSGIFLGFSLLTKYVSNFLYIFFLGLIFLKYILDKPGDKKAGLFFKKNLFSYVVLVSISLFVFFIAYPGTWTKPERIILGTASSQAFGPIFPYFAIILLSSLADTFFFKNIFLKNILNLLSEYKKILIWLTSGTFLIFMAIISWNAYGGSYLFDFAGILSSPKSSYRETGTAWFMATNFYPLIFGISPIALLAFFYFIIKSFNKEFVKTFNFRISFYLIIFIFLYYLGSVFSHVSASIRYQIILYPLMLIISGIWIGCLADKLENKIYLAKNILALSLIIILGLTLFSIKPFYFSYASSLLPKNYHIDYKDMGVGSYEAAAYLNKLPEAKKLKIWSDKKGVCVFFVGKCNSKFDEDDLNEEYDYYVVSSGRKNLVADKIRFELDHGHPETPRIDTLYGRSDADKIFNLANRKSNYIKIFKGNIFDK